jgi:hypothetical protein
MPTPPVSKVDARFAFDLVNGAIKDGFKLEGRPSAIEEAARRYNAAGDKPYLNRRSFRNRYEAALNLHGFKKPKASSIKQDNRRDVTPEEHAEARARSLSAEITRLVTRSRYPLINPEAILVESYLTRCYDRHELAYTKREGTPRTWLTDTLKVAPVRSYRGRRFLFTGAQNDAPIHEPFWANLKAYAEHIGGEIVVGPWTYETMWWSENNPTSRAYDTALSEYLCFGQMAVGDNFVFVGDMNTLPTASRPISDLVTHSRGRWAVFPHCKIQLITVPSTDPTVQAHQVMTSGAVTRPKVIPRKAGVKSIFHHIIGATIVEFDSDGDIFCRQLNAAEDGSFYDLDALVANGEVTRGHRARSLVIADLHRAKLRPQNTLATFGLDLRTGQIVNSTNLIDALRPEMIFLHDIYDNETRNHHHANDNAHRYEQAVRGRDLVIDEIAQTADFLIDIARADLRIMVVESNHDIGLERYVREGRYRMDGKNIRVGLQLEDAYMAYREQVAKALDAYERPPKFSLLEHAIRTLRGQNVGHVRWIYDGDSFLVDGVECGHHGFRGANGAKGTAAGFARLGRKISFGDKHSPSITDAAYGAGAMELSHGYNKGPSSWATSHVVQYQNGKRALITMQHGKFAAR